VTTNEMLEKAGWYRISPKKRGIIAWWRDRVTGYAERQRDAVRIQRERNKLRRQDAKADLSL
jgi:hypothetical protein